MLGKGGEVRLKAGTRIGVLCSQLRYVSLFISFFLFTPIGRGEEREDSGWS
jgi:hypothetical protein